MHNEYFNAPETDFVHVRHIIHAHPHTYIYTGIYRVCGIYGLVGTESGIPPRRRRYTPTHVHQPEPVNIRPFFFCHALVPPLPHPHIQHRPFIFSDSHPGITPFSPPPPLPGRRPHLRTTRRRPRPRRANIIIFHVCACVWTVHGGGGGGLRTENPDPGSRGSVGSWVRSCTGVVVDYVGVVGLGGGGWTMWGCGAGRKAPCLFSRRITHGNNGPVSTHVAGGGGGRRASARALKEGDFIISY